MPSATISVVVSWALLYIFGPGISLEIMLSDAILSEALPGIVLLGILLAPLFLIPDAIVGYWSMHH